jgi:cation diffusion facilitator family transporter
MPGLSSLPRFAAVAIVTAVAVIALKLGAWWMTASVGLLSDAVESLANLAGAIVAYVMLIVAERPPDDDHVYGHSKAEYFASGFEGALILLAAVGIAWAAVLRLLEPRPLEQLGAGLAVAAVATALNFGVSRLLLSGGRAYGSITLEASGQHLMTDVWTSAGVIAGVSAAGLTGLRWLDPVVALAVALHILATGVALVRRSALGLLDTALPESELRIVREVLSGYEAQGIKFHALRTRRAGRRSFMSVHVLVPGEWTVQRGHDLAEEVEGAIQARMPGATVLTHLEPEEDPASMKDESVEPPGAPRKPVASPRRHRSS